MPYIQTSLLAHFCLGLSPGENVFWLWCLILTNPTHDGEYPGPGIMMHYIQGRKAKEMNLVEHHIKNLYRFPACSFLPLIGP